MMSEEGSGIPVTRDGAGKSVGGTSDAIDGQQSGFGHRKLALLYFFVVALAVLTFVSATKPGAAMSSLLAEELLPSEAVISSRKMLQDPSSTAVGATSREARRARRLRNPQFTQYFTSRALSTTVQTGNSYMSLQSLLHMADQR